MKNKDTKTILKELSQKQHNEFGTCTIQNLKKTSMLNESMVENVITEEDNDYVIDI